MGGTFKERREAIGSNEQENRDCKQQGIELELLQGDVHLWCRVQPSAMAIPFTEGIILPFWYGGSLLHQLLPDEGAGAIPQV